MALTLHQARTIIKLGGVFCRKTCMELERRRRKSLKTAGEISKLLEIDKFRKQLIKAESKNN